MLTAVLMLVTSLFVSSTTYIHQYSLFLVWNLVIGICSGAAISVCESWIMFIWGKQCGPYMQALQFFRSLGYILAPNLIEPFLNKSTEKDVPDVAKNQTEQTATNITADVAYNDIIKVPYLINGSLLFVGMLLCLALCIHKWFNGKANKTASKDTLVNSCCKDVMPEKNANIVIQVKNGLEKRIVLPNRVKHFGYAFVFLSSMLYLFIYEEIFITYLPSYATKIKLGLSKTEANLLTTAFNVSDIIGKAISIFLALKMDHVTMIYLNLSVMFASLIGLIMFAESHIYFLWIGICLHGKLFETTKTNGIIKTCLS